MTSHGTPSGLPRAVISAHSSLASGETASPRRRKIRTSPGNLLEINRNGATNHLTGRFAIGLYGRNAA